MQKKILLIEDEDLLRDLYKRQLEIAGLPTDAFPNGKSGLESLQKNTYDLVLLDIMLPDTNGLSILKQIRQNLINKDALVVLLTNLGQESVIKEGFELGANGYLIKALYTPDQIVEEVKGMLDKKQT